MTTVNTGGSEALASVKVDAVCVAFVNDLNSCSIYATDFYFSFKSWQYFLNINSSGIYAY